MKQAKTKTPEWMKQSDSDNRSLWPQGKPLPSFKNYDEEVRFWHTYSFDDGELEEWQELKNVPHATRRS